MSDFIREVDEEYRRDRLIQFLSRFQVPLAVLVVLIIVGAGGWRYWIDHKLATAEQDNAKYSAAELLGKQGKTAEAEAAFSTIATSGPAGYAMLARMRGAELLAGHDPEGAAKAFDVIANDDALAASMRDTARLRGAMIRVDTEDAKAFEQRYGRFSFQGYSFRNSMRELLALAAIKGGDLAEAGKYLDQIVVDPGAPSALRNRAEAFRALVTGGPATAAKGPAGPASVTAVGAPVPAPAEPSATETLAPTSPTTPPSAPQAPTTAPKP